MCRECDKTILRVAELLEVSEDAARAAYIAVTQAYGEEQEAEQAEAEGPDAPGALDTEFLRVMAQAGEVTVLRPVLLGRTPYVLIQVQTEGEEGSASGTMALESGGLEPEEVTYVLRTALTARETEDGATGVTADGTEVTKIAEHRWP